MKNNEHTYRIAFFGTPQFSVDVLLELERAGIIPTLVVTAPDRPSGRNLMVTAPPVKIWAQERNISVLQPERLRDPEQVRPLTDSAWDLFIVAAYGKIIPQDILALPTHGTLNVHPSLLPRHRGPAPVEGQILAGDSTIGITVIELDAEMDHGPIVAQKSFPMPGFPDHIPRTPELDAFLWPEGGRLLAEVFQKWMDGTATKTEQDHTQATSTKKFTKEDGLINLADDPLENFRKIRALDPWPGTYFFTTHKGKKNRVVIKDAELNDGKLILTRVTPEGRKEMNYDDFQKTITS